MRPVGSVFFTLELQTVDPARLEIELELELDKQQSAENPLPARG